MAKTLQELQASLSPRETAPVADAPNPLNLPFHVVVVGRNGRVKYVFGYATEDDARAECARRQADENARTQQENAVRARDAKNRGLPAPEPLAPRAFEVITKPEGGYS